MPLHNEQTDDDLYHLCFGERMRSHAQRAVENRGAEQDFEQCAYESVNHFETKKNTNIFNTGVGVYGGQLPEESPELLVRYVMLVPGMEALHVLQRICEFVETRLKNFKVIEESFSIVGFEFVKNDFAQLRIQMFSFEGSLGVCLRVLDGTAQTAATNFWKNLESFLCEQRLAKIQEDPMSIESVSDEEDDFWNSESDDECSSLDFSLSSPISFDAEYVGDLMEDLEDPNFMLHSLLLLAWNCQMQQNMEIITQAGQTQKLFDTIMTCLLTAAADYCLPVVRSASILVKNLVEADDAIQITEEQLQVLVNTIVQWTIQNQKGDPETVTQSEEIAQLLSSKLPQLAHTSSSCVMNQLHDVYDKSPFQSVRQNIRPLVEAY